MFTALLDTNVLWPSVQRDFLLSLAVEGLYRPVWSNVILEELRYEETAKRVARGEDRARAASRADHLITEMSRSFKDAEVRGWEGLEGTYGLPDRDDEHVVAAAVVGGAGAIVTHNLKDFPAQRLPSGLEAVHPADFAAGTVELDPLGALRAVHMMAARSGRRGAVRSADDVLAGLAGRYGLTRAVETIRQATA